MSLITSDEKFPRRAGALWLEFFGDCSQHVETGDASRKDIGRQDRIRRIEYLPLIPARLIIQLSS